MKIIFLDIDGVLVTEEVDMDYEDNPPPFDKDCVQVLNEIIEYTNSEIVLSSTWKKVWDLTRLDFIFKLNGVIKSPIDITSDFNNREKEITDYVQRKALDEFVILDDMELEIFPDNFIQCVFNKGLSQTGIRERVLNAFFQSQIKI